MVRGVFMDSTFIFLQELLESTTGISLTCVSCSNRSLLEFLQSRTGHLFDLFFEQNLSHWQKLLLSPDREDTIYEHSVAGGAIFLTFTDKQANTVYFFGPVLTQPFSQENFLRNMEQRRIPQQLTPHMARFCSSLPVVASHILYRTGDLVIRHLTGRKTPLQIAPADLQLPANKYILNEGLSIGEEIVHMRQVEMRYESSAALTDAIKQGNLSLALHMIGQYSPDRQTPVRNSNPLRNAQNYCIVLNTQLRHALEETGIHPYRVDKLSNEIGMEIEQLKTTSQLRPFFYQIIRRYCRLVQEHTYPNLKPLTNLAVTYIKEHLADNLTVKETAKALTVNANYLSGLFHQEMGMTFIDFVNMERTRQAAALLKHTNLQIQQIASTVGYNNTSYFAKQFLRFQGISPSQYRKGIK